MTTNIQFDVLIELSQFGRIEKVIGLNNNAKNVLFLNRTILKSAPIDVSLESMKSVIEKLGLTVTVK